MSIHSALARPAASRNEPVRDYAPHSPERAQVEQELRRLSASRQELPLLIGGRTVTTGRLEPAVIPHDHGRILADAHLAGAGEVRAAIAAARESWPSWSRLPWQDRAAVFLKAAELLAGPWRDRLNAATMLGQSKTIYQAEIDAAAELIDFWRFNVGFLKTLYEDQPQSPPGVWNWTDYRPLEGFVFAITPFNFTAIAGNLATAPALMGNTVVWKPSPSAKLSAHFIMQLLREAGLPDGVINLVYGDAAEVAGIALGEPSLAGVHFTGSTEIFNQIQRQVAQGSFRNFPRIVGETGGKNFIIAHASADPDALVAAISRGGYEYQGQKCSAASRIFVPRGLWAKLKDRLAAQIESIGVGDVADFHNFMGAVINESAWRRLSGVLDEGRRGHRARTTRPGRY